MIGHSSAQYFSCQTIMIIAFCHTHVVLSRAVRLRRCIRDPRNRDHNPKRVYVVLHVHARTPTCTHACTRVLAGKLRLVYEVDGVESSFENVSLIVSLPIMSGNVLERAIKIHMDA